MKLYHGRTSKSRNFSESLSHALRGIVVGIWTERNMQFHFLALIAVVIASQWLNISQTDFALLMLGAGLVIAVELLNSAVEEVADVVHPEYSEGIQRVKDMSAGAVLVASAIAFVIALVVFAPHLDIIVR